VDELHRRLVRRIRARARAKRIPVTHLPDLAGVSRSHFWNVLRGSSSPTLAWLEKVARALEAEPSELLAREAVER